MMKSYALFAALGLLLGACASSMNSNYSSSSKQDKIFVLSANKNVQQSVQLGEVFLIEVESNPSTGYRWIIVNRRDLKCLQLKKEQTFPASSNSSTNLVGMPGKQQWQFFAKCTGDIQVRFEYRRPWEPLTTPALTRAQLNLSIQ